ncbi:MAG: hypothetical protein P1P74_08475, partial [Desulfuromonadales bacterium]|nr:hypothetical protein [Desulfuromonadales bacterium]
MSKYQKRFVRVKKIIRTLIYMICDDQTKAKSTLRDTQKKQGVRPTKNRFIRRICGLPPVQVNHQVYDITPVL